MGSEPAAAASSNLADGANADLTVADLGVAVSVRREDAPERGDAGGVLEGRVVRQRAVQVPFDLLRGQAALPHGRLDQAGVVALMRLELGGRV